uniref:PRA1 family protein n=1 Tax=Hemiselmis tepida TaxID=464990 RepID=A0A7S0VY63_9CRYP|mmetsp:Transcript_27637/g.70125  ORF Transcript_27637/g.70125 Transcript_27637/m.70125 type:complete len:194 (+) Transcript_27637:41-622(+)
MQADPLAATTGMQGQIGDALKSVNVQSIASTGRMVIGLTQRSMRPWITDFAAPLRFTKPSDDWAVRMRTNLSYFKGNYAAIFVIMVIFSILTNPLLLFSLVLVSAGWGFLLTQKAPQTITLGGKALGPFEQKCAMAGITFLAIFASGLSTTIFWALGVSTVATSIHSVCHTTEFHIVDGDEFGAPASEGPGQA